MVFIFPNLPVELSFMIEEYVLSSYKNIHKLKFATVLAEYKASNRIQKTFCCAFSKLTSKKCINANNNLKYDWHYCVVNEKRKLACMLD